MTTGLFAGAKVWSILRDYQDEKPIKGFVDAIDWGWFFFLTKPIFRVLHEMHKLIGNMGLAIIGLTFVIKLILFPLAYKSYVSMSKMKALQPEMEKIKERAGDDRMKMQQEVMALYKREKVNPAAGCLPILLQIPIFFSLYKVIFVTIELRHAPFFGWIQDLSAPDPTSILNLFGLLPFAAPGPTSALGILSIGVWPIILGISMWLQQKLNPTPTDKTQAMIFNWMPWVFMFMLGQLRQRAGDLLGGEQHHHLRPAVHHHAHPGGEAERARQHPRAAEEASEGGLDAWRASAPSGATRSRATASRRSPAVTLAAGATMPWDRVWAIAHEAAQGRAGVARLGALRQLQPRGEVVRADGDPRRGRRGGGPGHASPTRDGRADHRRSRRSGGRRPAGRLGDAALRSRPGAARPSWCARGRGMTDSDFPVDLDPEPGEPRRARRAARASRWRWSGSAATSGSTASRRSRSSIWSGASIRLGEARARACASGSPAAWRPPSIPTPASATPTPSARCSAGWGHEDFGVYAEVVAGGRVAVGDPAAVVKAVFTDGARARRRGAGARPPAVRRRRATS